MIPLWLIEDLGNVCDRLRETERERDLRTGQDRIFGTSAFQGWEEEEPVEEHEENQPERQGGCLGKDGKVHF